MAEDEDSVSNKKFAQNSNNGGSSEDKEQNRADPPYFPRLPTPETDEAKCNNNGNGDASPAEAKSPSSKPTGTTRKEENPFSFRHFLKRDLSLPGNSTYESTGARPKVYASTVQHSPTREPPAARDEPRADNTSSSSSVEVSYSVGDNSESKHNLYTDNSDAQLYRPGPEPPGMPSLPDFVQDHILVEQAYLNSNGPVSVDLDNLPDFTFNTSYNVGSSSLGRRGNSSERGFYEPYSGASTSSGGREARAPLDLPGGGREARVPLDLPGAPGGGREARVPLDVPGAPGGGAQPAPAPDRHLSLDLTESVPAERRNMSPNNTFPLDLPPNAGAESMRLPDFLPERPGRASPREPEPAPLLEELDRTRSELALERRLRGRLEDELRAARAELAASRRAERDARAELAASRRAPDDAYRESPESESTVSQLKSEIKRLEERLQAAAAEAGARSRVARDLRQAADAAEGSLRELLGGLARLRALGAALEPRAGAG